MGLHARGHLALERNLALAGVGALSAACQIARQKLLYSMSLVLESTQPVPLLSGPNGVILVSGSRVPLETVARAFDSGATAEEIVQQYPALALADVYCVLGYVLNHRADVAAYVDSRTQMNKSIRDANERRFGSEGLRARLLGRRRNGEQEA